MQSTRFIRKGIPAVLALILALALALLPTQTASAAIDPSATALAIAQAIATNPAIVTGASFVARPTTAGPDSTAAVSDTPLTAFPVAGSSYGILSTGRANGVTVGSPTPSSDLGGGNVRGNSDFDVTILKVDLSVPAGVNCLSIDFQFLSREYPEYIGQEFNDAFVAELNSSTWTTSGSTISAPNNFAFDPNNKPVSVNSTGVAAMNNANAAGTVFGAEDGATSLLQAKTLISQGANSVYLSIFDQQDRIYDSAVFVDNLSLSNVSPSECQTGAAEPKANLAKSFSPSAIIRGNNSTVTFTVENSAGNPAKTGLGFTDTLPGSGGVIFTGTPTTTCPTGSLSIGGSPSGTALTFSGGSLNAGQASCTITATVQGVTAGTYTNDTTRISAATGISAGGVNAILTVQPNATLTKAFTPTTLPVGVTGSLVFTITNGTGNPAQSDLGFTDTLPGGGNLLFTGTPTTTCPAGTPSIGGGGSLLTFSGGGLNAGQASCTITASVIASATGTYVNNSGQISAISGGLINSVNSTLTVNTPRVALSKAFSPTSITTGGTSTLSFTITNDYGNPAQSGIDFTDTLPGSGGAVFLTSPAPTTTCDAGTITIGGPVNTALTFTGGAINAGRLNCTITATVQGVNSGSYVNNSSRISGASANVNASGVNATLTVSLPNALLTKAFSPTSIGIGETTTATFTITNTAGNPARSGMAFRDTLPGTAGAVRWVAGTGSSDCGASSTFTVGGTNSNRLDWAAGSMAAGQTSCTVTIQVRAYTAGTYNNTATQVTNLAGLDDTGLNATLTVTTGSGSSINMTKAFSPLTINVGETSVLTFTLPNTTGNPAQPALGFSDTLPGSGGAIFLASPAPTTTCGSGSVVISGANNNILNLSNGSMNEGDASCTVTATVQGVTAGSYANTASQISVTQGPIFTGNLSSTLTVNGTAVTLTKAFSPTTVTAGTNSTLTFTLTNSFGNTAKSGIGFTDTLPGGGNVYFTGLPTTTCPAGINFSLSPDSTALTVSNGSLNAAQASCTITATVRGVRSGSYVNNSSRISDPSANLIYSGVNATLTVSAANAVLTKAFAVSPINVGVSTTLDFTITNGPGNEAKIGLGFTDTLPGSGGVIFTGTPTHNCAAGSLSIGGSPAGTALTFSGGSLSDGQASCVISATVQAVTRGTYINNGGRISGLAGALTNSVNATLVVNEPRPTLTKAFLTSPIVIGGTSTLEFTITNGDGNEAQSGLGFTDTLPGAGGAIFTGTPTTNCPSGNLSIGGGGTSLTLANGSLNASQTNCTITATVQGVSAGTYVNNSGQISGVTGGLLNNVNATLTVNPPAALTKAFSVSPIAIGGTSTLTFTLTNGAGNPAQPTLGFTDTLPGNGDIIYTGVPATTCSIGTGTISGNGQIFTFSGGRLNAGQTSCTATVTVEGVNIGSFVNDSSRISGVTGGLDTSGVNATLDVVDPRPVLTKVFDPTPIYVGQISTLTFTVANGSGNPAQSNLGFTDTLPGSGGVLYTGTPSTTCGSGTATIGGNPSGIALTFANGSMTAGQTSCTITVQVLGVQAGTYLNDNRQVTAVSGGLITRNVNATLVVQPAAALTKKFVRATIGAGGTSNLTFTITNIIPGTPALSNLSFTDTLPADVTVNVAPITPQCGGTITGAANVITITNASLAAGQTSCNITVQVTSNVLGTYPNTSANISGVTGGIDTSGVNATLRVVVNAQLTKAYNPVQISTGQTSTLTFTITNGTGDPARTDMDFTDTLNAALTVEGTPATPQCGGEVSGSGNVISVTNAALGAGEHTCTITVTVKGNLPGTYPNTSSAISNLSGALLAGGVNATLEVLGQPVLTKAFNPTSIIAGQNSTLTFTIANEAGNPAQSGLGFTDTLPGSGGAIFTGTPTTTCDAGSLTIGGTPAGTALTFSGGGMDAGKATCTITATVQGVTAGTYVNNAARVTGITGGLVNQVNATLNVTNAVSLTKKFVRATIGANGTSTLTFTLTNNTPGPDAVSGLAFTDTLPADVTVKTAPAASQCGGTVTGVGGVITYSGGSMAVGEATCDIVVSVTSNVLGTYVNDSDNFSGVTGIDVSGANATLRVVTNAQLTKVFDPASITAGSTSTLTFTITNGTGDPARTDMDFTDTLPDNVTVSGTPATPQCGGTVFGSGNEITVTDASMAAGQHTCTISVTVTSSIPGTYVNDSSNISNLSGALLAGGVNASLEVTGGATLSKAFVRPTIGAGGTSNLTFTITNLPGNPAVSGLGFTDTMAAQVTAVGTPTSPQCGATVTANANVITVAGASLAAGQASCTIVVPVTSNTQGVYPNTSANISGVTGGLLTNNVNATLTVRVNTQLTKAFSPATILIGQNSTLTFTITNGTGNPAQTGLGFTDTMPTQLTVVGTPTSPQCGGTVTANANVISFTGGTLAAGAQTCTITVTVTSQTPGTYVNSSLNISNLAGNILATGVNATLVVGGPVFSATPYPTVLVMGRVNRPITVRVAVSNTGFTGSTLNVTLVSNSNPAVFTVTGFPLTLAQGAAAQTFSVGCEPLVGADRTGTLVVQTNEAGNPQRTFNLICRPAAQTVAVFRPSGNFFHMRYTNSGGFANASTSLGVAGDLPLKGDWNGDGFETVGIWRPSTGVFILRDSNAAGAPTAYSFVFGAPGDLPVSGDWNGDGKDSVGIFRPSTGQFFLRNALSAGPADFTMTFGTSTDTPLAGDFDGDGVDSPAFFRPSTQRFYINNQVCNGCAPTASAVLWYGLPGDLPVVGDWNADGVTGIGVWRPSNLYFYLRNNPDGSFANLQFQYGITNDRPLAGFWAVPPTNAPEFNPGADEPDEPESSGPQAPTFEIGK